ncbi:hypothetical protein DOJK_02156 [Patescibacteria group bacterium]|nr:hypothetical protein DOJK_02156 [Patescibacteria group bacterium]
MNDQVKNTAIQQLNVTYVPTEDRLLLKIGMANQSELSVWLTYRVTKKMSQVLEQTPVSISTDERVNTPYNQQLEQQFVKQEKSQKLNFSDDYQKRESLNQGELFLVVDCRIVEGSNGRLVLDLICSNKKVVNVGLNDELLLGLANMLQKACLSADWHRVITEKTLLAMNSKLNLLH